MSTLSMWKFRASLFAIILAVAPSSAALHAQDMDEVGGSQRTICVR